MTQARALADELLRRSGFVEKPVMAADMADPIEEGRWIVERQQGKMFPEAKVGQPLPKEVCPLCSGANIRPLGNMAGDSYGACDGCGFIASKTNAMDGRTVTPQDIEAANKALGLNKKKTTELSDLIYNHANSQHFSGQVIAAAARAARENNMRMGSYDALNIESVRAKDAAPMKKFLMIIEINGERQTVGVETNDEAHARETLAKMQPNARIISMQAQDEFNPNQELADALRNSVLDDDDMRFEAGENTPSFDPHDPSYHLSKRQPARDALTVSAEPVKAKPVETKPVPVVKGAR